jgi:hypothetical protein
VVFVVGVPRSGTSWLISLLALHPDIAAVSNESHLFDIGVDRLFVNLEIEDRRHLRAYVSRAELADLIRDLCDGVMLRMRDATKPGASFVAEKTPMPIAELSHGRASLSRKLECYPDAWFVHIVREGHEVASSLARMPWMGGRSQGECFDLWNRCIETIRQELAGSVRYHELSYAELVADAAPPIGALMQRIGVASDPGYLDAVVAASGESYDGWPAGRTDPARAAGPASRARRLGGRAKRMIRGSDEQPQRPRPEPSRDALRRFVETIRDPSPEALNACTTDEVTVTATSASSGGVVHRTGTGDDARRLLADVGGDVFTPRIVRERWAWSGGTWLAGDGNVPSFTGILSGPRGDGSTVELHLAIGLDDDRVSTAWLFVAQHDA